jgi:hypothetical protein
MAPCGPEAPSPLAFAMQHSTFDIHRPTGRATARHYNAAQPLVADRGDYGGSHG